MKGLEQYRNLVFFCLHVLFLASAGVQGAVLTAEQLISQKVEELNRFIAIVEANSRNCGVLNGCGADVCTRMSCYEYGTPGSATTNYQCLGVQNNTDCGLSCKHRNFDFSRSFLRRVDEVDERISRTVCTHRNLDDAFKTSSMSDSTHFFRAFFGSVDGTFRIYPGADEDCTASPYDPRTRPWYIESTSVPKAVTILLDSGLNMRSKLSGGTTQETYGSKGAATALAVLDTLKEDEDYVTLITFDGDGSKPLNTTMIYNKALLYRSFSIRLPQNVAGGSKMNTNASATSDAINSAITALSTPSPVPANYLKVVIVLTTGEQLQNLSQTNISSNTGVNTFVYNFQTTAPQCSASARTSLESIAVSKLDNPLFALQSFYSFLASVHKSFVGDEVDYGQQYADYSGIDNSTLTLGKAAFGSSGELLGVLGIDFYEKKVNEQYPTLQFQSIVDTARSHQPQTVFDTAKDLNTSVCVNLTDPCPGLATNYVQGFLCQPKSKDKRIGCCGKCVPKKNWVPTIVGSTVGGGVGLLVIALLLFLFYRCYWRPRKEKEAKAAEAAARYRDDDLYKAPGSVSKA